MGQSKTLMQIVDLRQVRSRALEELFQEEAEHWRRELYWDYRPSQQLIRKFIDSRSLTGYAALNGKRPAGYGFYVIEEQKGLIGGLFVSPRYPQIELSRMLLVEMLESLRGTPLIERVEAQLMPFGAALDSVLTEQHFRLHQRQFMILELAAAPAAAATICNGIQLETWTDRFLEPCARLIQRA